MKNRILILLAAAVLFGCQTRQNTDTEQPSLVKLNYDNNETVTYYQAIDWYRKLAGHYAEARLLSYGTTDAGKPLHLFVMSSGEDFDPGSVHAAGKRVLLINNGIHPGEPEGIDASIRFADDVLRNHDNMHHLLDSTVICIIPVYNIGGCLNRSAYHRTGQTTPKETGHRGNAKNLDLNRDFTKMDTQNAKTFARIFREWDPDTFLDTHTTNGSDHQYTITLIPYQPDALPTRLGNFFRQQMIPDLYRKMAQTNYALIPYVNYMNESPKDGISLYIQWPHFSTGYTGLFNTLGFMTENHVYKDFPDRVRSVYQFIKALAEFTEDHGKTIAQLRKSANAETRKQENYVIDWKLDTTDFRMIRFKGYVGEIGTSPVTGLKRFGYNRNKPYDTMVPYYDHHLPAKIVRAPVDYILPQAWSEVVERMKINGVKMFRLTKDTTLEVEQYMIKNVETNQWKYNGHRYHNKVELEPVSRRVTFFNGDYVIPMDQDANRYIVEMLEPEAKDSFFRWNFFDPILEQREYYSSYGFEENALKYLDTHPEFKKQFEEAVKNDPELAGNHRAQLGYIYNNTEWADNRVNRYPVARIMKKENLPVGNNE